MPDRLNVSLVLVGLFDNLQRASAPELIVHVFPEAFCWQCSLCQEDVPRRRSRSEQAHKLVGLEIVVACLLLPLDILELVFQNINLALLTEKIVPQVLKCTLDRAKLRENP